MKTFKELFPNYNLETLTKDIIEDLYMFTIIDVYDIEHFCLVICNSSVLDLNKKEYYIRKIINNIGVNNIKIIANKIKKFNGDIILRLIIKDKIKEYQLV